MHPQALVREARAKNLDVISICDHNSSENVEQVMRAAAGTGLIVLPGMEVTTREEVHVIALLEGLEQIRILQEQVYRNLPGQNDEDAFGVQAVVNAAGEVEGVNDRFLIGATEIPLKDLVDLIHALGGLAIASHIDRQAFGIIGQLGFIPLDVRLDALEISYSLGLAKGRQIYPDLADYPFITSSDAHFIKDIGRAFTRMYLEAPTLHEIGLAFRKQQGRKVIEEI